ncbi:hypothetical protein CMI48_00175, partial [Candidatus Pacearchaeota archaeon]|nr:hypothetical protein [Candidatus Pacearchaeota archaeon]
MISRMSKERMQNLFNSLMDDQYKDLKGANIAFSFIPSIGEVNFYEGLDEGDDETVSRLKLFVPLVLFNPSIAISEEPIGRGLIARGLSAVHLDVINDLSYGLEIPFLSCMFKNMTNKKVDEDVVSRGLKDDLIKTKKALEVYQNRFGFG